MTEQFVSDAQRHNAARLGMWTFLAGEVLLFGGLFTAYAVYRLRGPDGFAEGSEHLYQSIGTANTAILLASSFTMARALRLAGRGETRAAVRRLALTSALGAVFLGLKAVEYWLDARESILPAVSFDPSKFEHPEQARLFLTLYLVMTGLHAAHLLSGVALVALVSILLRRNRVGAVAVESVGLYWHFVDLVWVFLLPLMYFVK